MKSVDTVKRCVMVIKKKSKLDEKWEENWELTKKEGNVWGIPQFLLLLKIYTKVQCQPPFHLPKQASNLATPSLPLQSVRPTPWVSIHLIFAIYHHAFFTLRPIRLIRLRKISYVRRLKTNMNIPIRTTDYVQWYNVTIEMSIGKMFYQFSKLCTNIEDRVTKRINKKWIIKWTIMNNVAM